MNDTIIIGIDLAKNVFQLHGMRADGPWRSAERYRGPSSSHSWLNIRPVLSHLMAKFPDLPSPVMSACAKPENPGRGRAGKQDRSCRLGLDGQRRGVPGSSRLTATGWRRWNAVVLSGGLWAKSREKDGIGKTSFDVSVFEHVQSIWIRSAERSIRARGGLCPV